MMKNLKTLKLSLIIVSIIVAITCFVMAMFCMPDKNALVLAEKVTITSENLAEGIDDFADEYNVGDEVDFPMEIKITHKDEEVTATNGVVFYPDGTTVYAGSVKLDKIGDYYVRYYFEDAENNRCVAEKKFSVTNKLYSVSSTNGSVVAVSKEEQEGKDFVGNDENVLFNKDDGLIVKLSEGDTFNFTMSLDLTNVGEDGLCDLITLDYRNVNFVPNPNYDGSTTDAWRKLMVDSRLADYCIIRLSDSYDLGKYVELYCRLTSPTNEALDINSKNEKGEDLAAKANYYPSFSACAVGQTRTALTLARPEGSYNPTYYNVDIDGQTYGLYIKNPTGGRSFSNVPLTGDHTPFTWKYDYKTNKIYVQQGNKVEIVSALSSSEIYGTDTFDGFSSGKVKLSIYMNEYVSGDKGRVDISSIGGYSGKELVENYGKLGFADTVALPVIDLGISDTDDRGIYVPLGSEYSIPVPTITSNEKIQSSSVYAYVNYGMENQTDIPIVDGKIKINKNRLYTLRYVVKNATGCVSEKFVSINPVANAKAITLNTSYQDFGSISAGAIIKIPEFSLETINNADCLNVKIKAVHEKETVAIDKEKRTFIPQYAGEYKIVYECSDNVFNQNFEYLVNCVASDNIEFIGDIVLPRYFIKNAEYTLEVVPAFSFDTGSPVELQTNAFISYDNGQNYTKINDVKRVKITGEETAIIKYTCSKGGLEKSIESEPIKIIDVGYGVKNGLRLRDYFLHEGFVTKSYEETKSPDVKYDSLVNEGDNTLKFINAIDLTALNFAFKIPANGANYKQVDVILTDYYDSSITYTVSYIANGEMCFVALNGEKALSSGYKFIDNSVTKKLVFSALNKELTVNDVTFSNTDLTQIFNSSLCYIDIKIKDIYGNASLIIDSLNAQSFRNNLLTDNVRPIMSLKDFSGEYEIGSVINMLKPCVTDVLSTVVDGEVSLYVEKDGEVLYSVDRVRLDETCDAMRDYQLKLESYGQYTISYAYRDGAGMLATKLCFVAVVDVNAPIIELSGDSKISVKQGKILTLEYKVSDDISSVEDIVVTVFMRDVKSNAFYTFNENKIPFHNAGTFEVYIYAKDGSGNYSYKTIMVTVG